MSRAATRPKLSFNGPPTQRGYLAQCDVSHDSKVSRMARLPIATLIALLASWSITTPAAETLRQIPSPAPEGSAQANLTVAPDGRVFLSWIERQEGGRAALRFASGDGKGWSAPRTIAEGANWFVNWADFPSMSVLPDGSLAAHWLVRSAAGSFAYDVNVARSFDGGATWGTPIVPHRDGTPTEHGFVSLFAAQDGSLAAVWLDGRAMRAGGGGHDHGEGDMSLRYATIARDGTLGDEALLDARTCECCQTSAALTRDGPVVVYRDRSAQEVRDIAIVRLAGGKWTEPAPVARDAWRIEGCPVNGPAVAASDRRVAVAWYTAVDGRPHVKVALSNDAGASFGAPVIADDGKPAGRVAILLLANGDALVSWLEQLPDGGAVRVRRIGSDGTRHAAVTVTPAGTARSNGFPRMVRTGRTVVFAWSGSRVLTAAMAVP